MHLLVQLSLIGVLLTKVYCLPAALSSSSSNQNISLLDNTHILSQLNVNLTAVPFHSPPLQGLYVDIIPNLTSQH